MLKKILQFLKLKKNSEVLLEKPNNNGFELRLVKYTSQLYIDCANLLLKNGFIQNGDYVFTRQNKNHYTDRHFCLYHFYTDGLTLNIYYPSESHIVIKNVEDMQNQIDRFKDEFIS